MGTCAAKVPAAQHIPLLLLHAFAANVSRRVSQVLEEQSAGMVAEYAEGRG